MAGPLQSKPLHAGRLPHPAVVRSRDVVASRLASSSCAASTRAASCRAAACRAASWRSASSRAASTRCSFPTGGLLSRSLLPRCLLPRGLLAFGLQSCGLDPLSFLTGSLLARSLDSLGFLTRGLVRCASCRAASCRAASLRSAAAVRSRPAQFPDVRPPGARSRLAAASWRRLPAAQPLAVPPPAARPPGVRPPVAQSRRAQLPDGRCPAGLSRAVRRLPCRFLAFGLQSRGLDSLSVLTGGLLSRRLLPCRGLPRGLLAFGLLPCGLDPCRLQLLRLPLCLPLRTIELGKFNGSLPRLRFDSLLRGVAGISRRRHHGLRTRGAWRCGDDGRWHRWSGRHGQRGLVGPLHGDHVRRRDRCGRRVTGPFGAQRRFRRSRTRSRRLALAWHSASPWPVPSAWPWARSLLPSGPGRRRGHGRCQGRPTGNRPLDRCLLQRLLDRRTRRLRGCDLRRHEHDAQIGRLDPSLPPGEAEARKPKSLATEGQAQQQRVNQQGEQERETSAACVQRSMRGSGRWPRPAARADRAGVGSDGGVRAALEPIEPKRAPPSLLGPCSWRGAGWSRAPRDCRPDRPTGHGLANAPRRHS